VLSCVLALRVVWLAWSFYFAAAPRYPLESATIALVIVGLITMLSRSGDAPATERHSDRFPVDWLPGFIVAAVCLYAPALRLGLLSDDYSLRALAVSGNLGVGSGWFFRPLPLALWRVLLAVRDSAMALHALNIVLHGVNAFLVGALGVRLGLPRRAALVGAAMFLTFPAAPEAVAWASGIQDVLLTTLALAAVLVAGEAHRSAWRTVAACGVFALALASKETAICVPLLVAICWFKPLTMRRRRDWWMYVALVGVAVTYTVLRVRSGLGAGYLAAPSRYFFKQMLALTFGTLITPWRTPASFAAAWLPFLAVVTVTALLTHALLTWRRADLPFHRAVRLTLWALASVAPVFTFFFVTPQLEGSRYLYLAECGWALLTADLIRTATTRVNRRPAVFLGASAVAILASAVTLEREIEMWRRAADLRDRVLVEAHASMQQHHCTAAHFVDVPESVDGPFVFRMDFVRLWASQSQTVRGRWTVT
jgi:hypothetical protein